MNKMLYLANGEVKMERCSMVKLEPVPNGFEGVFAGYGRILIDDYWGVFIEPIGQPNGIVSFVDQHDKFDIPTGFSIGDYVWYVADEDSTISFGKLSRR